MRIQIPDLPIVLPLIPHLLFGLAVIANIKAFTILFNPFYKIQASNETYFFNAFGLALNERSPMALLNTIDWDTGPHADIQGFLLLFIALVWSIVTFGIKSLARSGRISLIFAFFLTLIGLIGSCLYVYSPERYMVMFLGFWLIPIGIIWLIVIALIILFRGRNLFFFLFSIPLLASATYLSWLFLSKVDAHEILTQWLLFIVTISIILQISFQGILGKNIELIEFLFLLMLSFLIAAFTLPIFPPPTDGFIIYIQQSFTALYLEYGFNRLGDTVKIAWLCNILAYSVERFRQRRTSI